MNKITPQVIHLTTVHPRYDTRIFHKQCWSLANSGIHITLIVGDGLGDEVQGDISIIDIGKPPKNRIRRMLIQTRKALAIIRKLKPKILHFHDPELLSVGAALARDGVTVIYDAHEDLPRQILTKQWIPSTLRPLLSRVFEFYENWRVRQLSAVITATPHIEQRFAMLGVQTLTIANYPHPHELASETAVHPDNEAAICYVGSITRTRGARELVAVVEKLPGVKLLLCGRMEDEALDSELRAMPGWAQVEYLGQIDRAGVRAVMARARVGMVTLLPLPSYQDALPVKMFEYMSAGLPVVASSFPLWRSIVEASNCGRCVDPTDIAAIASTVHALLQSPALCAQLGAQGKKAVQLTYNWPQEEARLIEAYRHWLPERKPGRDEHPLP